MVEVYENGITIPQARVFVSRSGIKVKAEDGTIYVAFGDVVAQAPGEGANLKIFGR